MDSTEGVRGRVPWRLLFWLCVPSGAVLGVWCGYIFRPMSTEDWRATATALRRDIKQAQEAAVAATTKANETAQELRQLQAEGVFEVVRTTSLWLKDGAGKDVAVLGTFPDGPKLCFFDAKGVTRIGLGIEGNMVRLVLIDENHKNGAMLCLGEDGPGLRLADENNKSGVTLCVEEGGPGVVLTDENGETGATLTVSKDGPGLSLRDEKGKLRASLNVDKDGPALVLSDEKGKLRASLIVDKDGPFLHLGNENGKTRAALMVVKDMPWLTLLDENGKERATLGCVTLQGIHDGTETKRPPSSLVLFDKEGKVLWSTP